MNRTAIVAAAALNLLALTEVRSAPREQCIDNEMRDRIRTLVLEGFDQALKNHAANLFSVWLRDPDDLPTRAQFGTQNSIKAYIRARELALKWNPPPCP